MSILFGIESNKKFDEVLDTLKKVLIEWFEIRELLRLLNMFEFLKL